MASSDADGTTPPGSPPEGGASTDAAPGPGGESTPFALAQRLVEQRVSRAEALAQLQATGLDEEAARVALNAVDGATPSDLPDATLAPGINPLSPGTFALSDIGLSGSPAVALYWMAFGAVLLGLVALLLVLPDVGVGEPLRESGLFWGRFGMWLGGAALVWGVVRLVLSIRVRLRPKG